MSSDVPFVSLGIQSYQDRRLQGLHYEFGNLAAKIGYDAAALLAASGLYSKYRRVRKSLEAKRAQRNYAFECAVRSSGVLFIHIPKAAGTSVYMEIYGGKAGDHRSAVDYKLIFPARELRKMLLFSVTRDPVARFLSAFYYLKSGGRNEFDQLTRDSYLCDTESPHDFAIKMLENPELKRLLHFRDQVSFLKVPWRNDFLTDCLWRAEEMVRMEREISEVLGRNISFKQLNSSSSCDTFDHGKSKMLTLVLEKIYKDDFEAFGY